jgi:hypothetical protein
MLPFRATRDPMSPMVNLDTFDRVVRWWLVADDWESNQQRSELVLE